MKRFLLGLTLLFPVFFLKAQEPVLTINSGHEVLFWEVTPDGSQLITAGKDKTVKIWDVKQQRLLYTFPAFLESITALTITPSGKYILVGATAEHKKDSSEIVIFDIKSRKSILSIKKHPKLIGLLGSFEGHYPISNFIISPDETTFSCLSRWGYLRIFELATGTELFSKKISNMSVIDYSKDSKRLAILERKDKIDNLTIEVIPESLIVFDLDMKKIIFSGSAKTFSNVSSAIFSENSNVLLLGQKNGAISAFDFTLKKTVWQCNENPDRLKNILLSPENNYLVLSTGFDYGQDLEIKVMDYKTRKILYKMKPGNKNELVQPGPNLAPSKVKLSFNGKKTTIELSTGMELPKPEVFVAGNMLTLHYLFLTSDPPIMGTYYYKTELQMRYENNEFSMNEVEVKFPEKFKSWSLTNGQITPMSNIPIQTLDKIERKLRYEIVLQTDPNNLSNSSDGRFVMKQKSLSEYDSETKYSIVALKSDSVMAAIVAKKLRFVCFSPDNLYAFFRESHPGKDEIKINDDLIIYTVAGFNKVGDIEGAMDGGPNCLHFSYDGKYLAYNTRNTTFDNKYNNLYVIDLDKKELKWKFENFGSLKVFGAFSPDGKYLISEFKYPDTKISKANKFNLIDLSTGKFTTYTMPLDIVYTIFDSTSTKIFILTLDNRITVWDVVQQTEVISMVRLDNNKDYVVVTPDGRFDGTEAGIKNCLHYVLGNTIIPLESFYDKFYSPNLWEMVLGNEKIASPSLDIKTIKLPPLIKIISPESNIKSTNEQVTVTVEVTDQGGGVEEILFYQNGKLLESGIRGFKNAEKQPAVTNKPFTIRLTNGENRIKVIALNSQRTESLPDEINITFASDHVDKPTLYLLVIGINLYKNTKYNLNYAVADANSFKDAMQAGSTGIFNNVITVFVKDADATKIRITDELNKIKAKALQQDMFVLYYAGHGAMSEEERSLFYLIPTDVTQMFSSPILKEKAISATDLKQFSTEIRAQKQMYLLDACQSGGMEDVLTARGAAEEKAIAQLARSTGTYWLAAANSQQFATEFTQLKHGLFTYCVLQAFSGKADGQNDNKITVQELSAYLNDKVPEISKQYKGSEQYPVTYGFGQDFPLILIK